MGKMDQNNSALPSRPSGDGEWSGLKSTPHHRCPSRGRQTAAGRRVFLLPRPRPRPVQPAEAEMVEGEGWVGSGGGGPRPPGEVVVGVRKEEEERSPERPGRRAGMVGVSSFASGSVGAPSSILGALAVGFFFFDISSTFCSRSACVVWSELGTLVRRRWCISLGFSSFRVRFFGAFPRDFSLSELAAAGGPAIPLALSPAAVYFQARGS